MMDRVLCVCACVFMVVVLAPPQTLPVEEADEALLSCCGVISA